MMEIYGYSPAHERERLCEVLQVRPGVAVEGAEAREVDVAQEQDSLGTSVRAIHAPGHTRGHCAFLVEPEGILFLGDIDLSSFGPFYGDAWSDLEDFERTLALVRGMDVPPSSKTSASELGTGLLES